MKPLLIFCMLTFSATALLHGGDWPQILGPARTGIAVNERLVDSFPKEGPKTVWQRDVGSGFAGVAVAGGRAVLFHRVGNEEVVEAIDAASGKPLWKTAFPTHYTSTISADNGPRCVPVIHQGNVYLFGAAGHLHSVSLKDGAKRWSRAAYKEFGAPDGFFGAGSTPLVEGDRLLVNVGGRAGAGLVAFALADGKTVWQATDELASYSSPVAATIDGVRHAIFVTRFNVVSVDPANGKVRFRFPFGQRGPTVNAATPLVIDGHVFVTSSYGIGATFAKIGATSAEILWSKDDVLSSQYTTCVQEGGLLYGIDGRQDIGVARFRCFDPKTGKVQWTQEGFGNATLILAKEPLTSKEPGRAATDAKLVIMKTDGTLVLAAASPKSYRALATARLFNVAGANVPPLALPALTNGLLYVRDAGMLKCVDLRREK